MPYHLQNTQLRVVHKYTRQERNLLWLQKTRLIVLEHILPTTAEFLCHLTDAGVDIHTLIAKPYSIDKPVLETLEKGKGFRVIKESYETIEQTNMRVR